MTLFGLGRLYGGFSISTPTIIDDDANPAFVANRFQQIDGRNSIYVSYPADGRDWKRLGHNFNFLIARGGQLIPQYHLGNNGIALDTNVAYKWRFRLPSQPQATHRNWWLSAREATFVPVRFSITGSDDTYKPGSNLGLASGSLPSWFNTALTSEVTDPTGYTSSIDYTMEIFASGTEVEEGAPVGATTWVFDGLACTEVPRSVLDTQAPTDHAFQPFSIDGGAPIFNASASAPGAHTSAPGVVTAMSGALHWARRTCHFAWAVPYERDGAPTAWNFGTENTSFVDVFAYPIPVQAMRHYRDEDKATLTVWVYANYGFFSSTASVRVWAESDPTNYSYIQGISTGTTGWYSTTIDVATDNPDNPYHLPNSGLDKLHIEGAVTDGSYALEIWTVQVTEEPFEAS